MSFIRSSNGRVGSAGYFLESEVGVVRKTQQISQSHAGVVTLDDGAKVVPAGSVWPANDATAKGILYEDVYVTSGAMPGSVVLEGRVYTDRLPVAPVSAAVTALEAAGIRFIAAAPAVTRPY